MGLLADIRAGLAANLATIPDCQISPYMLSSPTPPTLEIYPDPETNVDYHQAFGNGVTKWTMCVRGIVAAVVDQGSQELIDSWLELTGPSSVFAAIESDKTLGGTVSDVVVRSCTGYTEYVKRGTQSTYFAAVWVVECHLGS